MDFKTTGAALALIIGCAGLVTGLPATTPAAYAHGAAKARASTADRTFIDGMVPHHQMAVMMTDDALAHANHAELKAAARKMRADQSKEIDQMKQWRKKWFNSAATPAMDHGKMKQIQPGPDFDREWMQEMITHHQDAIVMANTVLKAVAQPQTKALARQIITAQQKEQVQLRGWIKAWYQK